MVLRFLVFSCLVFASCARETKQSLPTSLYPAGPRLLLASLSDGQGWLDLFSILDGTHTVTVLPIHMDAVIRSFSKYGKTFVVNRFGMDSIYVLEKGKNTIVHQLALKKSANPQDVLMLDAKTVLITQRSESDLLIWNLETGQTQTHSLARFAFEKEIPDMTVMTEVDGQVWIALQRLKDRMTPVTFSQVVKWDVKRNVMSTFNLKASNPVTSFKRDLKDAVYIAGAANMGVYSELDGAIEKLDSSGASARIVVTENELKGDILDFEILDEDRGVALISKPNTALVTFDVKRGVFGKTLLETAGYELVRLLWDKSRGRLYVSHAKKQQPSLRIFDVATLNELPAVPLKIPFLEMEIEEP